MGGNSSNPNNNKQVSEALAKEVDLYKTGKMSGYSVRFQLFLYSASQLIAFHRFYQEVPIQQIFSYFANVQFFTYDEVNTIIQELAETAGNSSETDNLVRNFLSIINCSNIYLCLTSIYWFVFHFLYFPEMSVLKIREFHTLVINADQF